MSRNVPIQKIARFGDDPSRELALFENAMLTKMRLDDQQEYGPFVITSKQRATYTAKPWELVECDAELGPVSVVLPDPSAPLSRGSWIGVKNTSDTVNGVTVATIAKDIDGFSSVVVRPPRGFQWFYSVGDRWERGPSLAASPVLRVPDAKYNPVGLWNFHLGSVVGPKDYSGNGFNLSTETGTARYAMIHPSLGGIYFDGATNLVYPSFDARLAIPGAVTLMAILTTTSLPAAGANSIVVSHSNTGETAPDNAQYYWGFDSNTGSFWTQESGLGVNATYQDNSWLSPAQIAIMASTRTAGGVVTNYYNGLLLGTPSSALTVPDGGGSGRLRIGCGNQGIEFFKGVISSVALYPSALTAAQVLERYNFCLGAYGGFR